MDSYFGDPEYPDPSPEMVKNDYLFNAIWSAIKGWDISRYEGTKGDHRLYAGATGNDVMHILNAILPKKPK